jgi:hypothetical protein
MSGCCARRLPWLLTHPSHSLGVGVMLFSFSLVMLGCASSGIQIDCPPRFQVSIKPGACCHVSSVRVYDDEETIVLYGRLEGSEGQCASQGRVHVTIADAKGATLFDTRLPIRQGRHRLRGWYGADFRTRLDGAPAGLLAVGVRVEGVTCPKASESISVSRYDRGAVSR